MILQDKYEAEAWYNMAELSNYVRTIAIFIIFMSFTVIIIPENKYEKYIKLVMGIMLVAVIVGPLAGVLARFGGIGDFSLAGMPAIDMRQIDEQIANASTEQIEQILAIYHADLAAHLERLVNTGSQYTFIDGFFDIARNEDNFGQLLGLRLTVTTAQQHAGGMITIDPVRIDISVNTRGLGRQGDSSENVENEQVMALKNLIADFYNLDKTSIHVSIRH